MHKALAKGVGVRARHEGVLPTFISSYSLPFLFLIQLSHTMFQVAEMSFQTVGINGGNENRAEITQTPACVWKQKEGKRTAQRP